MSLKTKRLFTIIFLLAVMLRLGLTLVNRQANDNHVEVINLILQTHKLPITQDCGECFQPKVFHFTAAMVIKGLGLSDANQSTIGLIAQLVNFVAGLITLVIVWIFLRNLPVKNERLKLLAFALAGLNPAVIGINAQATNDTFAILFSTLALYHTFLFLQNRKIRNFLLIILFTVLGVSTKTHVWVTAIAIAIVLLILPWVQKERRSRTSIFAMVFLIAIPALTLANPLSQYLINYQEYGTPVSFTVPQPPFPNWVKFTPGCEVGQPYCRPGILSIRSGFFTFMFDKLLISPRVTHEVENYPQFRISFWSMMYAQAHSIHFNNFPPDWSTTGTQGFTLTRIIFILALFPTALLMIGILIEIFLTLKGIFLRDLFIAQKTNYGLFAVTFIGYILFVALYTLLYRDFAFMKAIFAFPALLVFPVLFLRAGEPLYMFLSKQIRWGAYLLDAGIVALLILYVVDTSTLITQIILLRVPLN
ncbi:MAG: glycosyltransferase family 39 protein [Chloroflexota bacterium]